MVQKIDVIIYGETSDLLQEILDWCKTKNYTVRASHGREWTGVELDGDGRETNHGSLVRTYDKVEEDEKIVAKLVEK
jgi:hypothetical protein